MRTIRALSIAAAVAVLLPSIAAAQYGRQFKDAWFWGIKVGGLSMADSAQSYRQSPTIGVDWLITRTHGGLYVSGEQSFFTRQSIILRDPTAGIDSGFRAVNLKNMRKLDVAVMGFPGDNPIFHPYVGIGFTLNQIASADAVGPFGNQDQVTASASIIQQSRTAISPLLIGGGQYRMPRFSVFGQLSIAATNQNFLLYNGKPISFGYEMGLRYNIGSSIDRQ